MLAPPPGPCSWLNVDKVDKSAQLPVIPGFIKNVRFGEVRRPCDGCERVGEGSEG